MSDVFRQLWSEPRAPTPAAPNRRDWMLLGLAWSVGVFEVAVRPQLSWSSPSVVVDFALLPTLLGRRTRPLVMVALAFGTSIALTLVQLASARSLEPLHTLAFLLLLPYSVCRWGSGREVLLGGPLVLVAATTDVLVDSKAIREVVGGYAVLLSVMALGAAVRFRERAHQRGLEQAKLREREQLARDLHDTVAHHVSAIAIRAQAGLAVAEARPDAALDALRLIAAEASRTLAEMRAMVRVLRRGDPAELGPQPRLEDLAGLASPPREGPMVEVSMVGDLDDLPPVLMTALYRIAQESITNARRHAHRATRIEVALRGEVSSVHLRVRDDGEPSELRSSAIRGYGLIGMNERAQLLGGTCAAGPGPERGWTVSVVLPRTGPTS